MLLKVSEISRKTFVLQCLFNNITDLQPLGCFVKKGFLKKIRKFHWKTLVMLVKESLFQKVAGLKALLKRDSCAVCKIFKNISFEERLRTAAS